MEQPLDGGGYLGDELALPEFNSDHTGFRSRSHVRDLGAKPGSIAIREISHSGYFGWGTCSRSPHAFLPRQRSFISSNHKSKSLSGLFFDRKLFKNVDDEQSHWKPAWRKGFNVLQRRRLFSETSYRIKNNNLSLVEKYNSSKKLNEYLKEKRRHQQSNGNDAPTSSDANTQENGTLVTLVDRKSSSYMCNRRTPNSNKKLSASRSRLPASRSPSFTISKRRLSNIDIGGNTDNLPPKDREKHECDLPDDDSFSCIMKRDTVHGSISSMSNYIDLMIPRFNNGSINYRGDKADNYKVTYTSSSPLLKSFFSLDIAPPAISEEAKGDSLAIRENSDSHTTPEHHEMKPILGELRSLKLKYYIKHDLLSPLRTRHLETKERGEKNIVYNPYYTFLPEFTSSSSALVDSKHEKCETNPVRVKDVQQSSLSSRSNQRPRSKTCQFVTPNSKVFEKGSSHGSVCPQKVLPTCINFFQYDSSINSCRAMGNELYPYNPFIRTWARLREAKQEYGTLTFGEESPYIFPEHDGAPGYSSTVLEGYSGDSIPLNDIIAKKVYSRISCINSSAKKNHEQDDSDLEKYIHCTGSVSDCSSIAQNENEEKENSEIISGNRSQNENQEYGDKFHHSTEDVQFSKANKHTKDSCTTNDISHSKKSDIREERGIRPLLDAQNIENVSLGEKLSSGASPRDFVSSANMNEYVSETISLEEQLFFSSLLSSQESFISSIRSSQYIGCPYCVSSTVLDDEMERKFNDQLEEYTRNLKRQLHARKSMGPVKSPPNLNEIRRSRESDKAHAKREPAGNESPQDALVNRREDRKMHSRHRRDKCEMTDVGGETWTAKKEKESHETQSPSASAQGCINSTQVFSLPALSQPTITKNNLVKSPRLVGSAGSSKIRRGESSKKTRHSGPPNLRSGKSPKSLSIAEEQKQFREKCRQSWTQSIESPTNDLKKERPTDRGEGLYKRNENILKNKGDKISTLRSFSIDTVSNGKNVGDSSPLVLVSWDESAKCGSNSLQENKRSYSLLYWNQSSTETKCTKHEFTNLIKRLITTISSSVVQIKASNSAPNFGMRCQSAPQNFSTSTNVSTYLRNKQDSLIKRDVPKFHNEVFRHSPTADTKSNTFQNNVSNKVQAHTLEAESSTTNHDVQCENQIFRVEGGHSLNENRLLNTCQQEEFNSNNTLLEIKHSAKSGNEQKAKELLLHAQDIQKVNDETHSSLKRDNLIQESLQSITSANLGRDQNQPNEYFNLLGAEASIPCYFKQMSKASSSREWNVSIEYPALPVERSAFSWWRHKQKTIGTFNKLFDTLGVFYLATSDEEISTDDEFDAISWHD